MYNTTTLHYNQKYHIKPPRLTDESKYLTLKETNQFLHMFLLWLSENWFKENFKENSQYLELVIKGTT